MKTQSKTIDELLHGMYIGFDPIGALCARNMNDYKVSVGGFGLAGHADQRYTKKAGIAFGALANLITLGAIQAGCLFTDALIYRVIQPNRK